jgi:hypothetical protein
LEAVTDLSNLRSGPRRLLELLHEVAADTVSRRGYGVIPSQVTIHQPQELLARALGCHLVTVWRWTQELTTAGLVASRAHFTTSRGVTRSDGTLFAVRLKQGHYAHLTHDDLSYEWRDLDGDRAAGNTAWKILQGSGSKTGKTEWHEVLKAWAVNPGSSTFPPLFSDHCSSANSVSDVVYALPLLALTDAEKRPALIGFLATTLSRALRDQHSQKFWCKVFWNAWTDEVEGRGGLQVLGAQLSRLNSDLREWDGLKNPAALLVSRLRQKMETN